MCGIAGLFLPSQAKIVKADLDAMLGVMRHRGPNGTGNFISKNGRFQAGFVRLAIIDLETGGQPIVEKNEDGRVLLGNGEIYNYLELRAELSSYPYQTAGDMESVLALADSYGGGFVRRLNGIYGLALYDRRRHELTLVRDRLGVKPLYWAKTDAGGIIFASEIKALFASSLLRPSVNEAAVCAYLAHGFTPGPETLFRGIYKLPPGTLMKVSASGHIDAERYWQARPAVDLPQNEEGIKEHLLALLKDSIRLQLQSDVPLGALLSGGIDSGLMVALAAEASSQQINAYTVSFEGAAVNEWPLAESIAKRRGVKHHRLDLQMGSVAKYLPALAWHCEEPLNDAALLPNFLVHRLLGQHVTVALNGTGGDELFAGYGRYFRLPVEDKYLCLPRWLRQGLVEPAVEWFSPLTAWKLRRAAMFETDRGAYLHEHSTLFPKPIRCLLETRLANTEPAQSAFCQEFLRDFGGPLQTAGLYADINLYLPEDLLILLDRTSMASSVEGRVPFLDHRLVEAALAVPSDIRAPCGRQKGLLRTIAESFLPAEVIHAKKQGFASPVNAWMKAGLAPLAARILTRQETLDRGWWTKKGLSRLLAKPGVYGFRIYALLMLELAVRIHVERPFSAVSPTEGLEEFAA